MKTILIVDDEPAARYGLRRALESKYRVAEADSAEAAREALTQAQANLLNAQQTFDRTSQLTQNGYATRAALDDAQKTRDVARTQARTADEFCERLATHVTATSDRAAFLNAVRARLAAKA